MGPRIQYSPLSQTPKSSSDEDRYFLEANYYRVQRRSTRFHWAIHCLSLSVIGLLSACLLNATNVSRKSCWDMYNYFSPVNEAIDTLPYQETRFKGSLWYQSPFKGPPTPEVEAAWQSIMQYDIISVTAEDIVNVGHNLSSSKFPPIAGGGYIAGTLGAHNLHCLHYIWQDHHRDSIPSVLKTMSEIGEMYDRHYEHCVDYIRQSLMCNFDTGIQTFNWVLDHPRPTPNGNAMHKCVDWESLQDWLAKRSVTMPEGFEWSQPADAETLDWNP